MSKYTTIDSKIIPSFVNDKLAVVFIKILKKQEAEAASAFSASFSSPTGSNSSDMSMAARYIVPEDGSVGTSANFVCTGGVGADEMNAMIALITDGMKEGAAEKVRTALLASAGVVKNEVFDFEWSKEDVDGLANAAQTMLEDFNKMKSGEASGSANNSKLGHYAFRKHLLIQGEKGGYDLLATIAA